MKINLLLPRTLGSRKSCKQLILLDLKIIQQIIYLILELAPLDYLIRKTEIQKKQLKSTKACNVNGK